MRATIAARVDEARGLIAESFPRGTRVTDPAGGYILWVELGVGGRWNEVQRQALRRVGELARAMLGGWSCPPNRNPCR